MIAIDAVDFPTFVISVEHSIPLRPIPADPCQFLQGNICPPELNLHNTLQCITFSIILQSSTTETRNLSSVCVHQQGLFLVRCAMWNQHPLRLTLGECFECGTATTACRLCIVSCSASSLCSCGAHFSLLLSALFQTSLHITPADKAPERPAR